VADELKKTFILACLANDTPGDTDLKIGILCSPKPVLVAYLLQTSSLNRVKSVGNDPAA
jgi:hypothetical protein